MADNVRIELDERSARFLKRLQNPQVIEEVSKSVERDLAKDISKHMKGLAKPYDYTGQGRKSIRATKNGDVSGLLHMAVQNYGRKAGKRPPPTAPIEKWAQKKIGEKGLGWVIARKIGRDGTTGRGYVQEAVKKTFEDIKRVEDHMDRAMAKQLRISRGRSV